MDQFELWLTKLKAAVESHLQTNKGEAATAVKPVHRYYNDMVQYAVTSEVTSDCNELSIYNQGTTTMYVNGVAFLPNTGISFDGKENEQDTTKYSVRFTGAGTNLCFVIRKCYVS